MTHFKSYRPYMAYLPQSDIDKLKEYSKASKVSVSQLIREGVSTRFAGENLFAEGYNQGINKCIAVIHEMKPAQMRFPSGASFAEVISDELIKHMWRDAEVDDESRSVKESM